MNAAEASDLLGELKAVDNRDAGDAAILMWAEILEDVPFPVAHEAMIRCRRDQSIRYLEPRHIIAESRRVQAEVDAVHGALRRRGLAVPQGHPDAYERAELAAAVQRWNKGHARALEAGK